MLTRNCVKLARSSRTFLYKNIPMCEKSFSPSSTQSDVGIYPMRFFTNTVELKINHYIDNSPSKEPIKELKQNGVLPSSPISNEDLLEKFMTGLSTDIYQKNRVYKNDLVRVIGKVKEINFSTKKQGLLLIRCCTELLPDETPASRMAILEQVWSTLKPHTKFEVEHYNELLKVYIANNRTITARSFIQQMAPVKPNITTYELILRALGELGDLNQATEVISNMKSQNLPATEKVFNALIICQGKAGNLMNIQEVLSMMKSLKLESSVSTHTAVARALAWNQKQELLLAEMDKAQKNGIKFDETHIMEIVITLSAVGMYGVIPRILRYLPEETLNKPSISPYMQSVSTLLVFQNHPLAALEIYKCLQLPSFGPKDDPGLHGRSLVRDCVKASLPSSVIALVAQDLMSTGRNPIALQNASESALQLGKVPLALDLFTRMKQMGMPLRPHYFWPIFIHSSKSYGEKGILNTLSSMVTMDVKPDYETIINYVLPYVSFTSPQNLMKKFKEVGLSATLVLTPMMETLLNSGQVRAASEICELFEGKVDAEKIIKPLLKGYLTSLDVKSTVHILEDITKKALHKNKDWVGRFLCVFVKRTNGNLSEFLTIIKALQPTSLKISTSAADYCTGRLSDKCSEDRLQELRNILGALTDENLVDEGEMFTQQLPHPKQMNEEELRAHLAELEAKGMNTRGVLRKLLQQYCREGNLTAARQMAEKCVEEGVYLSAGMKAAIFDLHVKLGEIDLAEMALADLNKTSPNFTLDEYKVIDFATLMVYRKKIDQAFQLISEQGKKRRVVGGRGISMNCWRLLDATAAHGGAGDVRRMFELLASMRFCQPSNALLGPLVRVHLKKGDIQQAVEEFVRLSHKYNKTPLKHELLCHIAAAMGDGGSEDNFLVNERANGRYSKLVQTVLAVDKKIHGAGAVQLTLIAVLADLGYKKSLRKLLLDPLVRFHPDALLRRCERFAAEKKLQALEALAECARDLRTVDAREIYDLMLDVMHVDNNTKDALSLWLRMQELDVPPSEKFVTNLCSMLKANNKPIPPELGLLLNKQHKKISN